jgi:mRNA interferase RelE/StbE
MNIEYLPIFLKELKNLRSTPYYQAVANVVFEQIPKITDLTDIKSLKKLQGYENAYRIKVGDYRIGIIHQDETITFWRVLDRKEIYRHFPPKN